MRTSVLFVLSALAFSILAGALEAFWARRAQRSLREESTVVLHPLTRHGLRRVRQSPFTRALYHLGLFVGFLLVTYVGVIVLKVSYRVLASWF